MKKSILAFFLLMLPAAAHAQILSGILSGSSSPAPPAITIAQTSSTGVTMTFSSNQTAGNSIFAGAGWCSNGACSSADCVALTASDSPNGSYTTDQQAGTANTICTGISRKFNIASTSSSNTVTPVAAGNSYMTGTAIEVNGLGPSPSFTSGGAASNSTASVTVSTSGSVPSGHFCLSQSFSSGTATTPSGWTSVHGSGGYSLAYFITVSSGVVSATWAGGSTVSGATIACY